MRAPLAGVDAPRVRGQVARVLRTPHLGHVVGERPPTRVHLPQRPELLAALHIALERFRVYLQIERPRRLAASFTPAHLPLASAAVAADAHRVRRSRSIATTAQPVASIPSDVLTGLPPD